ncbi:PIG-L deacetylase family protein [Streptomyces sp. NPDC001142]
MSRPHSDVLIVSPHFDDAALSVAGWIGRQNRDVTVVTVHGGQPPEHAALSEWEDRCGFTDPQDAFVVRDEEDQRSCDVLGARRISLPHPDDPHGDQPDLPLLRELLEGLVPEVEVLIPVGIQQPAHQRVRNVVLRALRGSGRRTRAYADLPYVAALPSWGSPEMLSALLDHPCGAAFRDLCDTVRVGESTTVRLDDKEWRRKRTAILAHASQLLAVGDMFEAPLGPRLLNRAGPLTTEMIWEVYP